MSIINAQPRPSIAEINSAPYPRMGYTLISGSGAVVPLIYGRRPANGQVFAQVEYDSHLYIGVIWCLGVIDAVERVFFNEVAPPSGVEIVHYKGTTTQGVDPWLQAAISGYEDTLIFSLPEGLLGAAYSVFNIPSSYSGVPRIQAIIRGKLVEDPNAAENSDPYANENILDIDFQAGGTDESQYSHVITVSGGATIGAAGLTLS